VTQVLCIGDMMVELSQAKGALQRGFGGDTFNTAYYSARLGQKTAYLTAFGDDPWSAEARHALQDAGIDASACPVARGRTIGLYAIHTAADGERSFTYWRDAAPSRDLFGAFFGAQVEQAIMAARLIYLSGVTLWLYDSDGLARLFSQLAAARAKGAQVAFDGNFRPRLWPDPDVARNVYSQMLRLTDICLATAEDEALLWADPAPAASHRRLTGLGIGDVVLKCGPKGALIAPDQMIAAQPDPAPVDTTAAGDSFNAAYLAARLTGQTRDMAAMQGHALAARVIRFPGAIMPMDQAFGSNPSGRF
jgi:2-dehydro-3-deoxygluconokinase